MLKEAKNQHSYSTPDKNRIAFYHAPFHEIDMGRVCYVLPFE